MDRFPVEDLPARSLGDGIWLVDTGFQRPDFDAAYLIVEGGRGAFVDTGTNQGVPRLLAALRQAGLGPADVDWVILTHVHLDHAGGAGELMAALPQARLVVHPRGAPHMIDPTVLYAGALAVYGQAVMSRSYGVLRPVDAQRVHVARDGDTVELAGRPLQLIDTPGHALHHHCLWDATSRSFFTGDTFGVSYREFDTARGFDMMPSTSPVQFQPQALKASIERLLGFAPQALQLTHYGRVTGAPALAASLIAQIDAMTKLARSTPAGPGRHAALVAGLREMCLQRLQAHACTLSPAEIGTVLGTDLELNAQGLAIWLDRGGRG